MSKTPSTASGRIDEPVIANPVNTVAEADAAAGVKLLTLNTHKGFTTLNRFVLHEIRDAVRAASADIVFLQEVIGSHQRHAARHPRWPSQPQYQFLAESIWPNVAYGRNAIYTEGDHGNAVLSKFPVVRYDNHDVSIGQIERRGLLHCLIRPPALPDIHAICVHLGLRETHRREQVQKLCELVRRTVRDDEIVVIAGDFNDWRGRAHAALAAGAGMREAFVEREGRAARSFPAWRPTLRLDRIYVRHAQVISTAVLSQAPWSRLSDHAALLATIRP